MNPRNFIPVQVKKTLVTPEERTSIIAALRQSKHTARYWAATFKRLPTTIEKFAVEAGVELPRV